MNRKIFHAQELEESILLKCLYYPKQSIDSVQSVSKFQWHFPQNRTKKNSKTCFSKEALVARSCATLWLQGLQPASLLDPWNSPARDTGAVCHSLFQRICLTQGSNPGLLHCKWTRYYLSHQWSPKLVWDHINLQTAKAILRKKNKAESIVCHDFKLYYKAIVIKWRRKWQPTPVYLPGESHGQRSLVGCSPWGHTELGMTEWLTHA